LQVIARVVVVVVVVVVGGGWWVVEECKVATSVDDACTSH
jgi:hypothetical protein